MPRTNAGEVWIVDLGLAAKVPFSKPGVFHLQQLQSVPNFRLQRRIGKLTNEEPGLVRSNLSEFFHLAPPAIRRAASGTPKTERSARSRTAAGGG